MCDFYSRVTKWCWLEFKQSLELSHPHRIDDVQKQKKNGHYFYMYNMFIDEIRKPELQTSHPCQSKTDWIGNYKTKFIIRYIALNIIYIYSIFGEIWIRHLLDININYANMMKVLRTSVKTFDNYRSTETE